MTPVEVLDKLNGAEDDVGLSNFLYLDSDEWEYIRNLIRKDITEVD